MLMVVAAICPKCSEIRARHKQSYNRGEPPPPLEPDLFVPVGGQPQPAKGEPSVCSVCDTPLALRPVPAETANGSIAKRDHEEAAPPPPTSAGVTTLFAAQPGEEMKEMRSLGQDRMLVVTSRRILVIDLNKLVEEAP